MQHHSPRTRHTETCRLSISTSLTSPQAPLWPSIPRQLVADTSSTTTTTTAQKIIPKRQFLKTFLPLIKYPKPPTHVPTISHPHTNTPFLPPHAVPRLYVRTVVQPERAPASALQKNSPCAVHLGSACLYVTDAFADPPHARTVAIWPYSDRCFRGVFFSRRLSGHYCGGEDKGSDKPQPLQLDFCPL